MKSNLAAIGEEQEMNGDRPKRVAEDARFGDGR